MSFKTTLQAPISLKERVNSTDKAKADMDIMSMVAILVSTGINKNDDCFMPEEVWPARSTPKDKPVNWEHDADIVIGTITDSWPTDKEGNQITDDMAFIGPSPQEFDLTISAKIWKALKPQYAEQIKAGTEAGNLFVSMECWFTAWDYLLGDSVQSGRIVARNSETQFMDQFLRCFGGEGIANGSKISRVLRNITFGGVGIVANPANPESLILSVAKTDNEKREVLASLSATIERLKNKILTPEQFNEIIAKNLLSNKVEENSDATKAEEVNQEVTMSNQTDLEKQIETLQAQLAEAQKTIDELKTEQETAKALEADVASKDASLKSVNEELAGLKAKHETVVAELTAIKEAAVFATRLSKIRESFDLKDEAVEQYKSTISKLSDDEFETWLADRLSFAASLKKPEKAEAEKAAVSETKEEEIKAEAAEKALATDAEAEKAAEAVVKAEEVKSKEEEILTMAHAAAEALVTRKKSRNKE